MDWPRCQYCGKEFYRFEGKYCSRTCSGRNRTPSKAICKRGHIKTYYGTTVNSKGETVGNWGCKVCRNLRNKAKLYGISVDEAELMEEVEACEICGGKEDTLNLDHDHQSGEARGYLCNQCNLGLGHFKDDPKLLRAAIKYLAK